MRIWWHKIDLFRDEDTERNILEDLEDGLVIRHKKINDDIRRLIKLRVHLISYRHQL
jgi:hypothetical protein